MIKTFIRGGQVTMHSVRMIRQVLAVTFAVSFILGVMVLGIKTWTTYTSFERSSAIAYYWASIKTNIPLVNNQQKRRMTQSYTHEDGRKRQVYSLDIANDRWHQRLAENVKEQSLNNFIFTLWTMLGFFVTVCGVFSLYGYLQRKKKILSGMKIVPADYLKSLVRKEAGKFTIGEIPLRKNSETQHILICGTTGTGKSLCFFELLPQIRNLKQRAVIIDTTGEFVSRYYRPDKDILINPFDDRTEGWNPWIDARSPYHYDELASAFIPQTGNDKFWSDAARTVFAETLKFHEQTNDLRLEYVLKMLLTVPLRELFEHISSTPAASLVDPAGDRTAMSIRAHLASYLKPLVYLDDARPAFSVRDWVMKEEEEQWLFITCTPDQRETLRPFMTMLFGGAINALMSCVPNRKRRLWFILDELASLQKQEAIPKALAEIRKYGGCVAVGLQDIPQLQAIYGRFEAESLVSLLNTRVIFRNGHPDTAKLMTQMLGEQEVSETVENISYGAHQMRDGVNLNAQLKMKPVITPTELMSLEDRQAYIKLPGNLPVAKITFSIPETSYLAPAFVPTLNKPVKELEQALEKVSQIQEITNSSLKRKETP